MKIINKTKYVTKDLRKLFFECIKVYFKMSKEKKTNLHIEITYSKPRSWHSEEYKERVKYRGCARLNGSLMWLRLPPDEIKDIKWLVRLFLHEYEHNLGYGHNATSDFKDGYGDLTWSDSFKIRTKEKKVVTIEDKIQKKYIKALDKLEQKKKLLKRTQNSIKKWQKKVNYYLKKQELQIAALPSIIDNNTV